MRQCGTLIVFVCIVMSIIGVQKQRSMAINDNQRQSTGMQDCSNSVVLMAVAINGGVRPQYAIAVAGGYMLVQAIIFRFICALCLCPWFTKLKKNLSGDMPDRKARLRPTTVGRSLRPTVLNPLYYPCANFCIKDPSTWVK
jgi:hypothetical protein